MRNLPLTVSAGFGSSCALIAYTRGATRALGRSMVLEVDLYDVPITSGLTGHLPLKAAGADLSVGGGAVGTLLWGQSRRKWSVAPH